MLRLLPETSAKSYLPKASLQVSCNIVIAYARACPERIARLNRNPVKYSAKTKAPA